MSSELFNTLIATGAVKSIRFQPCLDGVHLDFEGYVPTLFLDVHDKDPGGEDFQETWAEGSHAVATDRNMLVSIPFDHLNPSVVERLPSWKPGRPVGLADTVMKALMNTVFEFPAIDLPDVDPTQPICHACWGGRHLRDSDRSWRECKYCKGTGLAQRSGEPVCVAPGVRLDRWYVYILKRACARLSAPVRRPQCELGPLIFRVGAASGLVMPFGRRA